MDKGLSIQVVGLRDPELLYVSLALEALLTTLIGIYNMLLWAIFLQSILQNHPNKINADINAYIRSLVYPDAKCPTELKISPSEDTDETEW